MKEKEIKHSVRNKRCMERTHFDVANGEKNTASAYFGNRCCGEAGVLDIYTRCPGKTARPRTRSSARSFGVSFLSFLNIQMPYNRG